MLRTTPRRMLPQCITYYTEWGTCYIGPDDRIKVSTQPHCFGTRFFQCSKSTRRFPGIVLPEAHVIGKAKRRLAQRGGQYDAARDFLLRSLSIDNGVDAICRNTPKPGLKAIGDTNVSSLNNPHGGNFHATSVMYAQYMVAIPGILFSS